MEGLKVLLVDDELDFVSTLAERLEIRNIEVSYTTDGAEALHRVKLEPPDIVVLDVMMPGLGGLEVMQEIKRRHPEIKVILLTGRGATENGVSGMNLGAFDFLMKPIRLDDLLKKLEEAATEINRRVQRKFEVRE
jgi:DNA-binding response OmpR family regulator